MFEAASGAFKSLNDFLGFAAGDKLADALKIAVTAACETHTADDVIFVNLQFDFAGARAFCSVNHLIGFPFSE
jgi:hypothetical protein